MSPIIIAILTLGGIGILSAIILFIVSKRFYVKEDPRIEQIEGRSPVQTAEAAAVQAVMISLVRAPLPIRLTI